MPDSASCEAWVANGDAYTDTGSTRFGRPSPEVLVSVTRPCTHLPTRAGESTFAVNTTAWPPALVVMEFRLCSSCAPGASRVALML